VGKAARPAPYLPLNLSRRHNKLPKVPPLPPSDPIAKVLVDLAQHLGPGILTTVATTTTMLQVFPCGRSGYGTFIVSMSESKMKEIAQEQLSKKSAR